MGCAADYKDGEKDNHQEKQLDDHLDFRDEHL